MQQATRLGVATVFVAMLTMVLGCQAPIPELSGYALADASVPETEFVRSSAGGGGGEAGRMVQSLAAPAPAPQPVVQIKREVIYTGALTVLSPDPEAAVTSVRQLAEAAGGYASSVQQQRITVRVPAAQFDAVMEAIAELGLVTDRQIEADDVTEQLLDLQIRLDNLEALRGRMKALLDKAEAVEDALKIEKELARLTTEIETIKGRLRLLRDRVAMSTITVAFNAPKGTSSGLAGRVRPFPWVNEVGAEAFGAARLPKAQPKLGKAARVELPDGFVRFFQRDYRVYAIDRGRVVLKVSRHPNYDAADAAFWVDQVRDRLTDDLGVPVDGPNDVAIEGGAAGVVLTGKRPAGRDPLGYFVGLSASDRYVYLVEAWGPAGQIAAQHDALVGSLQTLRVSRGWW